MSQKNSHPAHSNNNSREEARKISGKINVSGEIEANIPKSVIEQYKAARQENTPRDNARFFVECITLGFVMLVAVFGGIQTCQSVRSSSAAVSAADTAKDALHISERAYIAALPPELDVPHKLLTLSFVNNGHIPTGRAQATLFAITHPGSTPEGHWSKTEYSEIQPRGEGQEAQLTLGLEALDINQFSAGRQIVTVAGTIAYDDGFKTIQTTDICYHSLFVQVSNKFEWVPCAPAIDMINKIKTAINWDLYT
jgi:hypothetical protein